MLQEYSSCGLCRVNAHTVVGDDSGSCGVDFEFFGNEFDTGCEGSILGYGDGAERELRVTGIGDLEGHLLADLLLLGHGFT